MQIQAVRGMNDILPEQTSLWQHLEAVLTRVLAAYGYAEIRLPIIEKTELFARSIGAVTDIVEKEMYTFTDRNGDSLTLRPEGTAGCARAGMQNGLLREQQRLWYIGPMFRHERPQKGRYRQFHQIGVEAYGMPGPDIDAELILMNARMWDALGLERLTLELNSLGSPAARAAYREALVAYLETRRSELDEDSQRRLDSNPLRILDSKNPDMQALIEDAPVLLDYLDDASRRHFDRLRGVLDACGQAYRVNTRLVRGLDYYGLTVFEWTTDTLGAQGTVCAGGRYDGLVAQLGGKETPAVGFALGLERLAGMLAAQDAAAAAVPHAYLVMPGERVEVPALVLAENLRSALPGLRLKCNAGGGSFKTQFKRADRSGAQVALIYGEDELDGGNVGVKYLRDERPQAVYAIADLPACLQDIIKF